MKYLIFILLLVFWSTSSFSLVDYSSSEDWDDTTFTKALPGAPKSARKVSRVGSSSSKGREVGSGVISVGTKYESLKIRENDSTYLGTVNILSIASHIQTPYSIYLDFSYWQGKTSDIAISDQATTQPGNPKAVIGFNWFKFGDPATAVGADLYAGSSFKANSLLGHSRNDKIFGLQTYKRFYDFMLLLGGEFVGSGKARNSEHMNIGNIMKVSAALGWVVSNDIRIAIEANRYKINAYTKDSESYALLNSFSYSTVSPVITLKLSNWVEMELGGVFNTKKAKLLEVEGEKQRLVDARLYDLPGIYGNSIHLGFGLSI